MKRILILISLVYLFGCNSFRPITRDYDKDKSHYLSQLEVVETYESTEINDLKILYVTDIINGEENNYYLLVPADREKKYQLDHAFPLNKSEIDALHLSLNSFKESFIKESNKYKQYKFFSSNFSDYLLVNGSIEKGEISLLIYFSSLYENKKDLQTVAEIEKIHNNNFNSLITAIEANSIHSSFSFNDLEEVESLIDLIGMTR